MMGHVNAEINAAKRHLEELDGQQVAAENLEEVIRLIRQSQNPQDACARLQKRFEIGYIKAKYILNLPLTQLSTSTIVSTSIEKEDYKLRLEFLLKLQPNGVMGAMYFSKKGIPFHLS
jgi:DNA gyrase subunit A